MLSAFAPLAGKHHQLLVRAVSTTHAQKSVRQDAAFEKSLELVCDKLQQARVGPDFDLGEEGLEMFPHQAVQGRLLRPPPLVMDRVRRGGATRLCVPVPPRRKRATRDRRSQRSGAA